MRPSRKAIEQLISGEEVQRCNAEAEASGSLNALSRCTLYCIQTVRQIVAVVQCSVLQTAADEHLIVYSYSCRFARCANG